MRSPASNVSSGAQVPGTSDPATPPSAPTASGTVVPTSGNIPFTVTITSTSTGTIDSTEYDPGDGTGWVAMDAGTTRHDYTTAGAHAVRIRVTNAGGSDTATIGTVTANSVTNPTFTSETLTPSSGGTAPFTATLTLQMNGDPGRYVVNWGDGTADDTGLISAAVHDPGGTGTYTLVVTHQYTQAPQAGTTYTPSWGISNPVDLTTSVDKGSTTITVSDPTPPVGVDVVQFGVANETSQVLTDYPLRALIPFSEADAFTDTSSFSVLDPGNSNLPVPCQFKVLTRWDGTRDDATKNIKFLEVIFRGTVAANNQALYLLQTDASSSSSGSLQIADSGPAYRVASGNNAWDVNKTALTLFDNVILSGTTFSAGAGDIALELNSGAVTFSNISTEIEEGSTSGTYMRCVIKQTATIQSGITFVVRYTFFDNTTDVLVETTIKNDTTWDAAWNAGTRLYVDHLYLNLPLNHNQTALVTTENGNFSFDPTTTVFRQSSRIRDIIGHTAFSADSRLVYPTGWPAQATGRRSHEHVMSYKEGTTGSETDYAETKVTEAIQVAAGFGSVCVATERFSERAAKEYRVGSGELQIGLFPEGIPGDTRNTGIPWRVSPLMREPVAAASAGNRPATAHPETGGGLINEQYAHPQFPSATVTTVNGEYEPPVADGTVVGELSSGGGYQWNGTSWIPRFSPSLPVETNARLYFMIAPGRWVTDRVLLRFYSSTGARTSAEKTALQELANKPVTGRAGSIRFRTTGVFGERFQETIRKKVSGNTNGNYDVDRWEKWVDAIYDDLNAEPSNDTHTPYNGGLHPLGTSTNPSGFYVGYQQILDHARPGKIFYRQWGWDYYGTGYWGSDRHSSLHYDTPYGAYINWFRKDEPRFVSKFRRNAIYFRDSIVIHGSAGFAGCCTFEKGSWPMHCSGQGPNNSHSWIAGVCLHYLIYGDELSYECAEMVARSSTASSGFDGYPRPSTWAWVAGTRIFAWGVEKLIDIYLYLGDLNPTGNNSVKEELDASLAWYYSVEQGGASSFSYTGAPLQYANRIPAGQSTTGSELDVSGNGYVLNIPSGAPQWRSIPFWQWAWAWCALARWLYNHPTADPNTAPWSGYYDSLAKWRTYMWNNCQTDSSLYWPASPDALLHANFTQHPPAAIPPVGPYATQWSGSYIDPWCMVDVGAHAYWLFKGTSYADANDLIYATRFFRASMRYWTRSFPGGAAVSLPSFAQLGADTDPNCYNQSGNSQGEPNFSVNGFTLVTWYWTGAGNGEQTKYTARYLIRRVYAYLAALFDNGEIGHG